MENDLPRQVLELCEKREWSLHWAMRGAYLHLEASELMEALRGKRGQPVDEAADVLIVLMSMTESNDIPWSKVVATAAKKVAKLMDAPHYPGEEYGNDPSKPKPHIPKFMKRLSQGELDALDQFTHVGSIPPEEDHAAPHSD